MPFRKFPIFAVLLTALLFPAVAFAQEQQEDSLVRLDYAQTAELLEINGQSIRKVVGPARFFHNNTYLLCDTAMWNIDTDIIDAIGNVSIKQEGTELTSEKMVYRVKLNLAEFRGQVVQLEDSDHNTLRTKHLDYNTKDSVAVFSFGGSMRDKDGQIIESEHGTYDAKIKTFTFSRDVNMFTDSIFVKTSSLIYESDKSLATFGRGTDAWQEDNMLSSDAGWYDRGREIFFFRDNVHVMSDTQEGWSDSLYFYRNTMDVRMLGRAQVTDTTRNVSGLAGKIEYVDSLSKVTMTRKPAVVAEVVEQESRDTVYFGADTLIYYTVRKCDIDSAVVAASAVRLENLDVDPVGNYRKKAAEEAAKAAAEAAKNDPNRPPDIPKKTEKKSEPKKEEVTPASQPSDSLQHSDSLQLSDSLSVQADSLMVAADSLAFPADSLGIMADSLAVADSSALVPPPDTTEIGFVTALRNVKVYREQMQVVCDSLEYSDLDSLARLFGAPVIWNEVTQQYSADSITVVIRNNAMEKASLMSNAFIHMEVEDSVYYNQIKGTEMLAYFSPDGELTRFDALGGASGLFFLEENDEIATVNKKESKMLSATFKDGDIERVYYYDEAKSDAYPVVQLSKDEQFLKGFNWLPELRPADRTAVTPLSLRSPERSKYKARPKAAYKQTDIYFPGYISDIYRQIAVRDSLERIREMEARQAEAEAKALAEEMRLDSLARVDSLAVVDSLARVDSLAAADSIAAAVKLAQADSIARADSIASAQKALTMTEKELRKEKAREERKAAREKRIKEKEARWERLDKRDADRAAEKQARKDARIREKKRRLLMREIEQRRKDAEVLQKYIERLEARQARKDARKNR